MKVYWVGIHVNDLPLESTTVPAYALCHIASGKKRLTLNPSEAEASLLRFRELYGDKYDYGLFEEEL